MSGKPLDIDSDLKELNGVKLGQVWRCEDPRGWHPLKTVVGLAVGPTGLPYARVAKTNGFRTWVRIDPYTGSLNRYSLHRDVVIYA